MAIPPKYADIGKAAADLLNKDYPVGSTKLEVKTTASNGVNFTVSGNQDSKSGVIAGELKTKLSSKANGLTVTQSWTTSNVLGLEVEHADQLVSGLKSTLTGSLLPAAGQKNAKVALEYKQDYVFSNAALDVFKGPSVSADVSVGADGFVVGGDLAYNTKDGKLSKFGGALGYATGDYAVSVHAFNNCSAFAAAFFHKVSSDIQAAAKAVWDKKSASANVAIEVGTKVQLDDVSFVKAKINNAGLLGLGYTQEVRKGVKLALGGSFDTARFHENAHKLGLSLTLEA